MKRIMILLLASMLMLNLTYCKNVEPSSSDESGESKRMDMNVYDPDTSESFLEDLEALISNDIDPSDHTTTQSELEADFISGSIDIDTYNTFTVLSALEPESLPNQYALDLIDYDLDIQSSIGYLLANWDQLDNGAQDKLESFLLPISDKDSFFNPNNTAISQMTASDHMSASTKEEDHLLSLENITNKLSKLVDNQAYAAGVPDNFVTESFNEEGLYDISFSYYTSSTWSETTANNFRTGFDKLIDEFEYVLHLEADLMDIYPSKPIRVEFVPFQAGLGFAYDYEDHFYIKINSNIITDEEKVRSTFAHELFHCFQYTKGIHSTTDDLTWAMEATATWAMHYCYENDNVEHRFLNHFERTLEKQRISSLGKNEYASYMLFYYLTDYMGEDELIRSYMDYVAANPSQAGSHTYFNSRMTNYLDSWPETYGDFAVANLNLQGHEVYRDNGLMSIDPEGTCYMDKFMGTEEEHEVTVSLDAGGIQYYQFDFSDDTDFISFTFDNTISDDMIYRQAYIEFDGQWRYEDWTEITDKDYWKKSEDISEHVETVILIYSNAHMEDMAVNCDHFTVTTYKAIDAIQIDAIYTYETDQGGIISIATIREEVKPYMGFLYMTTSYEYTVETTISVDDGSIVSQGSISGSLFDAPNLNNAFPRIILPMAGNNQQLADSLSAIGIGDINSEFGYLILIPYQEEETFGTTSIAFPSPVGVTEIEGALPNMGLVMAGGVMLPYDLKNGPIEETFTINLANHHNPLTNMFEVNDFSALMTTLESMGAYNNIPDMPDMPDMGDIPDMSDIPGMPSTNTDSLDTSEIMDALQAYMNTSLGSLELRISIEMD